MASASSAHGLGRSLVLASSSSVAYPLPPAFPRELSYPAHPAKLTLTSSSLSSCGRCSRPASLVLYGVPYRTRAGWALSATAAAAASSPPPRPSFLREKRLGDFAWNFGASVFPLSPTHQPCSSPTSISLGSSCTCPSCIAPAASDGFVHNLLDSKDDLASAFEEAALLPSVTLSSLIRNTFKDAEENCQKEVARLGKDKDADVVHDLRVVLRRLRNMLRLFSPFIDLRKELDPRQVSRLLRVLGVVRDSGAMVETLDKVRASIFSTQRTGALEGVVDDKLEGLEDVTARGVAGSMDGARVAAVLEDLRHELLELEKQQLAEACKQLKSKHGRQLFARLKVWAESPTLHPPPEKCTKAHHKKQSLKRETGHEDSVMHSPLSTLSPSILSPYVSALLLHPGWHIDDIWTAQEGEGAHVSELNEQLCETAHDLRKHLRELRYAMELFVPAYEEPMSRRPSGENLEAPQSTSVSKNFREALGRVKELQGILGELQDLQVLSAFLHEAVGRRVDARHLLLRGKGAKKAKCQEAAEELAEAVDALLAVQRFIHELQKEVWACWILEKNKINSAKGRAKLFKALIPRHGSQDYLSDDDRKPDWDATKAAGEKIRAVSVAPSFAVSPASTPVTSPVASSVRSALATMTSSAAAAAFAATAAVLAAKSEREWAARVSPFHRPSSAFAEDDADLDMDANDQHGIQAVHSCVDLKSPPASLKVVAGMSCRLWSRKHYDESSSVRWQWDEKDEVLPKRLLPNTFAEILAIDEGVADSFEDAAPSNAAHAS